MRADCLFMLHAHIALWLEVKEDHSIDDSRARSQGIFHEICAHIPGTTENHANNDACSQQGSTNGHWQMTAGVLMPAAVPGAAQGCAGRLPATTTQQGSCGSARQGWRVPIIPGLAQSPASPRTSWLLGRL